MKATLIALAVLVLIRAQGAPDAGQTVPDLDSLRGSYQRNLAAIQAARQTRTEPIKRSYSAELDRLQREITSSGDLDGALQVKAERERLAAEQEPTPAERKAMLTALAALRTRYEQALEPVLAVLRDADEKQKSAYLDALDSLQRRLTVQNQLQKASLVRVERDTIAGPLPEKTAPPLASTTASTASTPTSTASTAPVGTLSRAAVAALGQLDAGFAEKIATALRENKIFRTELSNTKGNRSTELLMEGAVLVGFEFSESKSNGLPDIRALRPIYLTTTGAKAGVDRGKIERVSNKVLARPGYAVGGIFIYHASPSGRIQGIQVVFMKMIPSAGRLDRDANSTYTSQWFGFPPHKDKPMELGDDGRPVIGVYGFQGDDIDNIGLIQTAE